MLLLPTDFELLGRHLVGAAAFVSNLQFWAEVGYFDKEAALKPLLHLWSLSVEEQFYLIWPVLLAVCFKLRVGFMALGWGVLVTSFASYLYLQASDPAGAFYLPTARAWELMAGALCALTTRRVPAHVGPIAGLILILLALAGVGSSVSGHVGPRLLAVAGACLIVASTPGSRVASLLGSSPMRALGLISYPLYLWHWPILSFLHIRYGFDIPLSYVAGGVAAAFVLSILTYLYIEMPIRHARVRRHWPRTLAATVVLLGLLGGVTTLQAGFPGRLPREVRAALGAKIDLSKDARVGRCWLGSNMPPEDLSPECLPSAAAGSPAVWVWGDSHAARLYVGVEREFGRHFEVGQITRDGCPPVLGVGYELCQAGNAAAIAAISEAKPNVVVLYAQWSIYASPQASDPFYRQLTETVRHLSDAGIRNIVVIGPPPYWSGDLPAILLRAWTATGAVPLRLSSDLKDVSRPIDELLRQSVRDASSYVSLLDLLCDQKGCLTLVPDAPDSLFTPDYGHFSSPGADYVARSDQLRRALLR
jgi:peptidoglycan/LPS O-acetylase OafA/YrhL